MKIAMNKGSKLYFSSVQIAKCIKWEHKNLLSKIRTIVSKNPELRKEFFMSTYNTIGGVKKPQYLVSKQGVLVIVKSLRDKEKANVLFDKVNDLSVKFSERQEETEKVLMEIRQRTLKEEKERELKKEKELKIKTENKKMKIKIKKLEQENEGLKDENFELRRKKDFLDRIMTSKNSITVSAFAKVLSKNGIKIGGIKFFRWLRKNKILCSSEKFYNMPMQKYIDNGVFELIETPFHMPHNEGIYLKPMITPKGQKYLYEKLKDAKVII